MGLVKISGTNQKGKKYTQHLENGKYGETEKFAVKSTRWYWNDTTNTALTPVNRQVVQSFAPSKEGFAIKSTRWYWNGSNHVCLSEIDKNAVSWLVPSAKADTEKNGVNNSEKVAEAVKDIQTELNGVSETSEVPTIESIANDSEKAAKASELSETYEVIEADKSTKTIWDRVTSEAKEAAHELGLVETYDIASTAVGKKIINDAKDAAKELGLTETFDTLKHKNHLGASASSGVSFLLKSVAGGDLELKSDRIQTGKPNHNDSYVRFRKPTSGLSDSLWTVSRVGPWKQNESSEFYTYRIVLKSDPKWGLYCAEKDGKPTFIELRDLSNISKRDSAQYWSFGDKLTLFCVKYPNHRCVSESLAVNVESFDTSDIPGIRLTDDTQDVEKTPEVGEMDSNAATLNEANSLEKGDEENKKPNVTPDRVKPVVHVDDRVVFVPYSEKTNDTYLYWVMETKFNLSADEIPDDYNDAAEKSDKLTVKIPKSLKNKGAVEIQNLNDLVLNWSTNCVLILDSGDRVFSHNGRGGDEISFKTWLNENLTSPVNVKSAYVWDSESIDNETHIQFVNVENFAFASISKWKDKTICSVIVLLLSIVVLAWIMFKLFYTDEEIQRDREHVISLGRDVNSFGRRFEWR